MTQTFKSNAALNHSRPFPQTNHRHWRWSILLPTINVTHVLLTVLNELCILVCSYHEDLLWTLGVKLTTSLLRLFHLLEIIAHQLTNTHFTKELVILQQSMCLRSYLHWKRWVIAVILFSFMNLSCPCTVAFLYIFVEKVCFYCFFLLCFNLDLSSIVSPCPVFHPFLKL